MKMGVSSNEEELVLSFGWDELLKCRVPTDASELCLYIPLSELKEILRYLPKNWAKRAA